VEAQLRDPDEMLGGSLQHALRCLKRSLVWDACKCNVCARFLPCSDNLSRRMQLAGDRAEWASAERWKNDRNFRDSDC
jgi:hypothetical protein